MKPWSKWVDDLSTAYFEFVQYFGTPALRVAEREKGAFTGGLNDATYSNQKNDTCKQHP